MLSLKIPYPKLPQFPRPKFGCQDNNTLRQRERERDFAQRRVLFIAFQVGKLLSCMQARSRNSSFFQGAMSTFQKVNKSFKEVSYLSTHLSTHNTGSQCSAILSLSHCMLIEKTHTIFRYTANTLSLRNTCCINAQFLVFQ